MKNNANNKQTRIILENKSYESFDKPTIIHNKETTNTEYILKKYEIKNICFRL